MTSKTLKDQFLDVVAYVGLHHNATEDNFPEQQEKRCFRIHKFLLQQDEKYRSVFNKYSAFERSGDVGVVIEQASQKECSTKATWKGIFKLAGMAISHAAAMARANYYENELYKKASPALQERDNVMNA